MKITSAAIFQDIEILIAVLVCILLSAYFLDKLGEKSSIKGVIGAAILIIIGVALGATIGDTVNPDFGSHLFGLVGGTIGIAAAYLGKKTLESFQKEKQGAEDRQEDDK